MPDGPIEYLPRGARMSAYGGDASDPGPAPDVYRASSMTSPRVRSRRLFIERSLLMTHTTRTPSWNLLAQ